MLVDPIAKFLGRFKTQQFRRAFVTRFGLLILFTLVGSYLVWGIARPTIEGTPCTQQLQLDLQDLSKRGYKILFELTDKPRDQAETYVMNADGTALQPFVDSNRYQHFNPQKRENPFSGQEAVWSPDGSRTVKNTFQLGSIDPVFRSPIGAQTGNVKWSPDGQYIVFPVYTTQSSSGHEGNNVSSQIYIAATQYMGACALMVPVAQLYRNPEWVLEIHP